MTTTTEPPATGGDTLSFLAATDLNHIFGSGTAQEHHALDGAEGHRGAAREDAWETR